MIAFARFEIRRTLRDSRFMLFLVAMPALLYLLLAGFANSGREDGLPSPVAFMVAMMCYAAIGSACYAIGPPLAAERARGWIRQLQIMPLAGTSWLAVKLIQGALLILPGIAVVAATAAITHSPGLTPARWAALAAVLLAGSLPFTVLGLVIGQAMEGQSANSATLFTVLGLSFAGGLLIPDSQLPQALRHAATVLPSRQLADLARAAAAGHSPSPAAIGVLAAWTFAAAGAALALRRRDGSA
jgi:ABC-2 type transport system permease protein